jgi:hypothetical protein
MIDPWVSMSTSAFNDARRVHGIGFTLEDGTTGTGIMAKIDELLPLMPGGFQDDVKGALDFNSNEVSPVNGQRITLDTGAVYRIQFQRTINDDPIQTMFLIGKDK